MAEDVSGTDPGPDDNNWSYFVGSLKGILPTEGDNAWGNLFDKLLAGLKTPAGAITGLTGLYSLFGNKGSQIAGYGGGIPQYDAYYAPIPAPADVVNRPIATPMPREYGAGAVGQRYLPQLVYGAKGSAPATPASMLFAPAPAPAPAEGGNKDIDTGTTGPITTMPIGGLTGGETSGGGTINPPGEVQAHAHGGIADFARGGAPRYLRGDTDGMADELNTSIDGTQPAKLSHGEFVIPADVVSDLGNGNSDAGAKKLHQMMDRVRMARHGTKAQGKRINPDKFTPGGIANYAGGGAVAFNTGGTTGTTPTTPTPVAPFPTPTSTTNNLSAWIGPYVTDYLGKAMGLANMPYTPFMGQLTAGISPLMTSGFQGLQNFNAPGTSFTSPGMASSYMSPYTQNVVNIQQQEAQRQADIAGTGRGAQFARSGAFGGARQAIENAQAARNLALQKGDIQARGLQSAYEQAQQQYNQERTQGLQGLGALVSAGQLQRNVEQAALDAQKAQFEEERAWPYKQLQFQQSLISSLPTGTQTVAQQLDPLQKAAGTFGGLESIYATLGRIFK